MRMPGLAIVAACAWILVSCGALGVADPSRADSRSDADRVLDAMASQAAARTTASTTTVGPLANAITPIPTAVLVAPVAIAPRLSTAPAVVTAAPTAIPVPATPVPATPAPYYGIQEINVVYGRAQVAITPAMTASLGTAPVAGSYGGQATDGSGCTATETYMGGFVGYGLVTQTGSTWVFTFPIQTGTTDGVVTPITPAAGQTTINIHCAWFHPATVNRVVTFTK